MSTETAQIFCDVFSQRILRSSFHTSLEIQLNFVMKACFTQSTNTSEKSNNATDGINSYKCSENEGKEATVKQARRLKVAEKVLLTGICKRKKT